MNNFILLSLLSILASCNPYNNVVPVNPSPSTEVPAETPSDTAGRDAGENLYKNLTCDLEVGNGSGQVAMGPDVIGNNKVICIKAGTYSSADIFSLTGVGEPIVVQNKGMVTFTDRLYLSNLKNVVVSGAGTEGLEQGIIVFLHFFRSVI